MRSEPVRVLDMVGKVLRRLEPGDCIKQLNLIGHGSGGNISVGDGKGWIDGKRINGDDRHWKAELLRLQGKFCAGAEIRLLGCNTGVCDAGAEKMHELANLFGVTVKATNQSIYGDDDFSEDGYSGGEQKLVEIQPGLAEAPGCLAEKKTKGVKEKEKTKAYIDQFDQIEDEIGQIRACGFRSARVAGLLKQTSPWLHPFDGEALEEFTSHYDLSEPYDAYSLGADSDALISVIYGDFVVEIWELALDYHALIVNRFRQQAMFLARDSDPKSFVSQYITDQGRQELEKAGS